MRKYKTRKVSCFALAMLCMCLSIYNLTFPHPAQAAGETVTIQITGAAQPPGFFPALLTVHVYDTVIFTNQASPASNFSIVADDGAFSSPAIAPGKQWIVTFNTPGEHEYHTSTNVPRMIGVIIVVPNAVSLLATPAPGAEATVLALIKAGKAPPDTLIVPSPTHTQPALATSPFGGWLLPALFIGGAIVALLGLGTGSFYLLRFLRRRLRKRGKNDDDDDDDDEEDDDDGN